MNESTARNAKFDGELADKLREASYSLSYDESLKHLLSEAYHRLDSGVCRIHKKKDGYLMITHSGESRFMTLKEKIVYILFGFSPSRLK